MNNRNKISYLLGAGASAKTVPVVAQFPVKMREISREMLDFINKYPEKKDNDQLKKLRSDLDILAEKSEEFTSLDTYANYLYKNEIKEEISFNRLKIVTSLFLIIIQAKYGVDSRVNHFLTKTIRRQDPRPAYLNGIFNIITWNYDIQIALALKDHYFSNSSLLDLLNVLNSYPCSGNSRIGDEGIINVLHLNGICGLVTEYTNTSKFFQLFSNIHGKKMDEVYEYISQIIHDQSLLNTNFLNYFTFNWEFRPQYTEYLNKAVDILSNSETIVVIGYSFPEDNWNTFDEKWLSKFKDNGKKLVIQDVQPSEDLIEYFSNSDIELKIKKDVNRYFIHDEILHLHKEII